MAGIPDECGIRPDAPRPRLWSRRAGYNWQRVDQLTRPGRPVPRRSPCEDILHGRVLDVRCAVRQVGRDGQEVACFNIDPLLDVRAKVDPCSTGDNEHGRLERVRVR
jgi:hypothetical protein